MAIQIQRLWRQWAFLMTERPWESKVIQGLEFEIQSLLTQLEETE